VITGFIDMQYIAWHNTDRGKPRFTLDYVDKFPGMFGGIVLNATWAEMQPTQGADLTTERLDDALDQVRQYNAAHPTAPLGVKLRIFSGNHAPGWAKRINGRPLRIQRNYPGGCPVEGTCPISIGRVWDPDYISAWRAFQKKAAQIYDSEPLIRSVAITSCTMQTDEPFVMPTSPPVPPGYTNIEGQDCLTGAVDDYKAWRRTAIDFTFNAFVSISPKAPPSVGFSTSLMDQCRIKLGSRCELGNHAFGAHMSGNNLQIVQAISAKHAPIHYQTVGPKGQSAVFVSWTATVQAAKQCNATALELWPMKQYGGFMSLNRSTMRDLHHLFNGDRAASPSEC
jgi:hypothetical protein